ncbi:cell wall-binding repeat-containing protein [Clostridium sp. A1-XYC3]|uniref:Cell wall-binding repeat-containing protein n=1 Tax=Clostridium tanneri TaxID=3037988 RepID=A0ABU4JV51_9CLOT|nr:cell wall-binding repeat-containing protein [Clostridium sp. A1-XYC3]MDW8801809.1 cell wall-binding repeat-containing protein [Clostridium sp. A1-XYC3]
MKNIKIRSILLALFLVTFLSNYSVVHGETISHHQDENGGVTYERHDLPETLSLVEEMVNEAIEQKSLIYYNEAYNAVMGLYDEENREPLLNKLTSIDKEVLQGSKSDTTTKVTGTQLADSTTQKITTQKIIGGSSYEIATAVSKAGWDKADSVVLASGEDFPDALCGTSLAIQLNAPILFTAKIDNLSQYDSHTASELRDEIDKNNNETKTEITRLGAKKVYILGGQGAVSSDLENSIRAQGIDIVRLQGTDRFQTSLTIGQEIVNKSKSNTVFLSNAYGFADALSVATYAGQQGSPILLTEKDSINATTKKALSDWKIKNIYIAGGNGVVSENVEQELNDMDVTVTRLGGVDRYDTSQKITNYFNKDGTKFTLVTAKDYHDALVASVYGSRINQPVMLMDNDSSVETKNFVKDKSFIIVGNDISEDVIRNPVPVSYYSKDGMTFSTLNDMPVLTEKDIENDEHGTPRYIYYSTHMERWICPKIKSTAISDIENNFEVLDKELGFGHGAGFAAYNLFGEHVKSTKNSVINISNQTIAGKYNTYNTEIMIQFDVWDGEYYYPENYRVKQIAKQLFKFYFPKGYETMFNYVNTIYKGTDAEAYALLDHVVTIDSREVLFTCPQDKLMIWVSAPGEHLRTTP